MLGAGGSTIEFYNASGATLAYRSVVQLLPPDKSLTGVGKNAWRAQSWAPGTALGSLSMLGVVTSENGVLDQEYGSAQAGGGVVSVNINASGATMSQYQVMRATASNTYFVPWADARATMSAVTASAGDLSASTLGALGGNSTASLTAYTSQINQNINSLRLEYNKLVRSVETMFAVQHKVRAIYVGTATLSASGLTGDVVLIGGPLGSIG